MTICNRCKTEIRKGERVTIIHWHEGDERQHRDCIATLRDRAETAEAELAEAIETNEEISRISEENGRFIDDIINALGYNIRGDEAFLDEIVDLAAALRAELDALKAETAWRPITGRDGEPGLPPGEYVVLEPYFGGWSARRAYLDKDWFRLGRGSVIYMHDDLHWYLRLPRFPPGLDEDTAGHHVAPAPDAPVEILEKALDGMKE